MIVHYFKGIRHQPSKFGNDLHVISDSRDDWYCCAYNKSQLNKQAILKESKEHAAKDLRTIQRPGRKPGLAMVPWDDNSRNWQFHHVIEEQNLSDLPLEAMGLQSNAVHHREIVPTVLVHRVEHQKSFTDPLGIGEFREMYLHPNASTAGKAEERVEENDLLYRSGKYTLDNALDVAKQMAYFYDQAYMIQGYHSLRMISRNFFDGLLQDMENLRGRRR